MHIIFYSNSRNIKDMINKKDTGGSGDKYKSKEFIDSSDDSSDDDKDKKKKSSKKEEKAKSESDSSDSDDDVAAEEVCERNLTSV